MPLVKKPPIPWFKLIIVCGVTVLILISMLYSLHVLNQAARQIPDNSFRGHLTQRPQPKSRLIIVHLDQMIQDDYFTYQLISLQPTITVSITDTANTVHTVDYTTVGEAQLINEHSVRLVNITTDAIQLIVTPPQP